MLNIELTGGQKLQVGFIAVVLAVTGFLFIRNSRAPVDMTINSWTEQKRVGLDPKLPIGAKNPADPSKTTVVTVFSCHDGKLQITEFPADSGLRAQFAFVPDRHRKTYHFYEDPLAKVHAISDPYKHTLTFAAYSAANSRPLRLLAKAEMDQEQLKAEKVVRQVMLDNVTVMEQGAKTGMYKPDLYEKTLKALADYRAKPGDPTKNKDKAQAAHQVMDLALAYLAKLEADKTAAVQKYVDGVDAILKPEQKLKLGEMSKQIANRAERRGRAAG
jgi:hypothetical protein